MEDFESVVGEVFVPIGTSSSHFDFVIQSLNDRRGGFMMEVIPKLREPFFEFSIELIELGDINFMDEFLELEPSDFGYFKMGRLKEVLEFFSD